MQHENEWFDFDAYHAAATPVLAPDGDPSSDQRRQRDSVNDFATDSQRPQTSTMFRDRVSEPLACEPSGSRSRHNIPSHQEPAGIMDEDEDDEVDGMDMVAAAHDNYLAGNPLRWISPFLPLSEDDFEMDSYHGLGIEGGTIRRGQEKWEVDREAAEFLTSIIAPFAKGGPLQCEPRVPTRKLKVEEPFLSTDPQTDLRTRITLCAILVAPTGTEGFEVDDERDEGIGWSSDALQLPARLDLQLASEKWNVDAETGTYMIDLIRAREGDLITSLLKAHEPKAVLKAPSPLLRQSSPLNMGLLSPSAAFVDLTSTPDDPATIESAELHSKLECADEMQPYEVAQAYSNSDPAHDFFQTGTSSVPSRPRNKPQRLREVRVLSPLMPNLPSESSEPPNQHEKTVAFTKELEKLLPDPDSGDKTTETGFGGRIADLVEALAPLAAAVHQRLDSERLVEMDTTIKVAVADMAPVRTDLLATISEHEQPVVLCELWRDTAIEEAVWIGVTKLERILPWSAFPSYLGILKPERDFDDGSCVRYLTELALDEETDYHRFFSDPAGLRVSESDEDEELESEGLLPDDEDNAHAEDLDPAISTDQALTEEITPALHQTIHRRLPTFTTPVMPGIEATKPSNTSSDNAVQMSELLKRRKVQLERKQMAKKVKVGTAQDAGFEQQPATDSDISTMRRRANENVADNLGQFLTLQGQSAIAAKLTQLHEANAPSLAATNSASPPANTHPAPSLAPIPVPLIAAHPTPIPAIFSSTFMDNRPLVRKIQELLPSLEITARDPHPVLQEADITISPSTGLMLTTLQKLNQKPLPGQTAYFGLREQIRHAAQHYERLLVLVRESPQAQTRAGPGGVRIEPEVPPLNARDGDALAELAGQMASLACEIRVIYVPGGEDVVAGWIAAATSRYGVPASQTVKLLQEETYWEQFLRAAGLNTFAAQLVLGQLKKPDVGEVGEGRVPCGKRSGLAEFVMMTEEERVRRFGPGIGGDGMLRRVSAMLDGRWMSAANAT